MILDYSIVLVRFCLPVTVLLATLKKKVFIIGDLFHRTGIGTVCYAIRTGTVTWIRFSVSF
jgi:hypothetical protein